MRFDVRQIVVLSLRYHKQVVAILSIYVKLLDILLQSKVIRLSETVVGRVEHELVRHLIELRFSDLVLSCLLRLELTYWLFD